LGFEKYIERQGVEYFKQHADNLFQRRERSIIGKAK
jgi:hypothetical protein